jgi:hypothetical protein
MASKRSFDKLKLQIIILHYYLPHAEIEVEARDINV